MGVNVSGAAGGPGGGNEVLEKTGDYTIVIGDHTKTFIYTGASHAIFTLPSVASGNVGTMYKFVNTTAYQLRIKAPDSDTINDSDTGLDYALYNDGLDYGCCELQLMTATAWYIKSGVGTWVTAA